MTDAERFKQWGEWIMMIHSEVEEAVIRRVIFVEIRQMIDRNPRIQRHSAFYEWMAGTYGDSMLMAMRRQVDHNKQSISLIGLLTAIERHPQALSRANFLAQLPPQMHVFGNARFDLDIGADSAHIDAKTVADDLAVLRGVTDIVWHYGTKRVAHFDAVGPTSVPTFKELDEALDLIVGLFVRYLRLLRQLTYEPPQFTYDWKGIFREPWIR